VYTPAPGGGTSNPQTFTINNPGQSWLDPGWNYRRAVTISNPGQSALTDYQVQIRLDSSFDFANAKSDGSDIRVTAADGTTLIPFWIETWIPSAQQGSLWVKAPTLPTGGTTMFLYYGNPNAGNIGNNADAVFDFYDGFDGTGLDGGKWSFANGSSSQAVEAGGQLTLTATGSSFIRITSRQSFGRDYLVEAHARHPQQGILNMVVEVGLIDASFGDIVRIVDDFPASLPTSTVTWDRQAKLRGQSDTNWNAMAQVADQQWHTFRVYRQSPNVAGFQIDDNPVETISTSVPISNLPVFLMSYTGGFDNQFVADWIRVRKFAYPEPVAALNPGSNPAPVMTSLSPEVATAGGAAFTLTVDGSGFVASSVVRWNGADRGTTFVSSTQLRAAIPAADIAVAGTVQVTVYTPAPGGGTSNPQTFTIN
jgi:hypothetical protein